MIANGTIVEVYEDPLTMTRKEGNARIIEHVANLDTGVDQYRVNFIGDDPEMVVVRTVAEHLAELHATVKKFDEFLAETREMVGGKNAG